jgi:hypothetical protein
MALHGTDTNERPTLGGVEEVFSLDGREYE